MNLNPFFAEATPFWERKRIIYNLVLATMAMLYWGADILAGGPVDWLLGGVLLLFFAVLANLLFCLAYLADAVIQILPMPSYRLTARWFVFVGGMATACMLTWQVLAGSTMV